MYPPQSAMGSHRVPSPRFPDSLRVDIPNHELMAGNYLASPHRMVPSHHGVPLGSPSVATEFPTFSITPSTQPTINPFHTPSPTPSPYNLPYLYSPAIPGNVQPNLSPRSYHYQQPISPSLMMRQKSPLLEDQQQGLEGANMLQTENSESRVHNDNENSSEDSVQMPTTIPKTVNQIVSYYSLFCSIAYTSIFFFVCFTVQMEV